MLFILEIVFFIMGLYALINAKLPSWFVGKGFYAEGKEVRLLSILMIAPLPLAFCAGIAIGIIDPDSIWIGSVVEFIAIVAAAIIVAVTLQRIRKPVEAPQINPTTGQGQP
jgi:hypothetical protein